jgi:hypothetical protein
VATDAIALGPGAVGMARRLGPTAWTVLTALALDAEATGGAVAVRASVRSLAAELGLNKDTVARALARLRHACLVVSMAPPFEPSAYMLTIPADVLRFAIDTSTDVSRPHRASRASFGVQLALLEAD